LASFGSRKDNETKAMRRRKRTDIFKLCALCFSTITLINLISECSAGATIHLEERMEVVRKVLREVPLIDG
jgi:membrane dipeptidase